METNNDAGSRYRTIGILGGMGAAASVDLYDRIVREAQEAHGASDDTDFPPMFIYNLPLRDFDETGITDMESVRTQLVAGVKKLAGAGSDFIVIACNTVHACIDAMREATDVPIVSILDVVADAAVANGYKKIGLTSSASTRATGIYEAAIAARGLELLLPTDEEQQKLNAIIGRVIGQTHGEADAKALATIAERLAADGAEAVILGCTELPLAITEKDTAVPLMSSTHLLAQAALKEAGV